MSYTKSIIPLVIVAIIMGFFIVISAEIDTPVEEDLRNMFYIKAGVYDNGTITTWDGNLWEYDAEKELYNGESCFVTFDDNKTPDDITDDIIHHITPQVQTWDIPLSEDIQQHVVELCRKHGNITPELIFAVIQKESNYKAKAKGDSGTSKGLMQVREMYHGKRMEKLGVTDLYDPYQNITVGVHILSEKIRNYDTLGEALTVYNAGDKGAEKYYFSKGIKENSYAITVMSIMKDIETI